MLENTAKTQRPPSGHRAATVRPPSATVDAALVALQKTDENTNKNVKHRHADTGLRGKRHTQTRLAECHNVEPSHLRMPIVLRGIIPYNIRDNSEPKRLTAETLQKKC